MGRFSLVGLGVLALGFGWSAGAQSAAPVCGTPPIAALNAQPNIFSEQQEQWLGDAMADMLETDYKPARNESQSAHLQAIVDRLATKLPPTQIKFHVLVIDSSEVNGFSIAGGHIYITRKLAAVAKNDDELAAVLGHEMGHIASHQFAFETTRDLQRLLGITSVGDRADIYTKFQKLMDARYTDKHPGKSGDSDDNQSEADKVGVYVEAAAGYRPQAFAEFWDRTNFTEGKTGSRLSDFFGITKPDQKRLRGMLKLVSALPDGCGGKTNIAGADFDSWHRSIIANQAAAGTSNIAPVAEVKLTPPLHMDLERLRFSPDGKTILAQDGGSIFAIARDPYAIQFRFDAENAMPAQFSPDSQKIVFGTPGLHSEEWSVTDKKLLSAHEPITQHDCLESKLSPDGRTVVCLSADPESWEMDLALLDSDTGATVWEKKNFFHPTYLFALMLLYAHQTGSLVAEEWMPTEFSADGNSLLVGPSDSKMAFDMRTRTPIKIAGDLKNKVTGTYAFIGNGKVAGVNNDDPKDSGVFSFPDGRQLEKLNLPITSMKSVSGPGDNDYMLLPGLKDGRVGLADLPTGNLVLASKATALDLWNGYVTAENNDGSVLLAKLKDGKLSDQEKVVLPASPLGSVRAVAISPDGKHLALSTQNHGGIWNVDTGKQEFLTLGFSNAIWAEDGTMYAEFPKAFTQDRHVGQFTMTPRGLKILSYTVDDKTHLTYHHLTEWKQIKGGWELTVHKLSDASVLWTKLFPDGSPRYTLSADSDELLFSSRLKLGSVRAKLKEDEKLAAEAAAVKVKDNGRLIEVVDGATGKTLAEMVLELPLNFDGTDGLNRAGDLLYMLASDNRTVVYSIITGKQLRQIFGRIIAIDPESHRICTVNRRDEAIVYGPDGSELAHFRSGSVLRYASFRDSGKRLLLLTADQTMRTVDVAKGDAGTAVASAQ